MIDIVTKLIPISDIMKYDPVNKKRFCPRCGVSLVKRNGPYGEFYACSNYPDCNYTVDTEYVEYDD